MRRACAVVLAGPVLALAAWPAVAAPPPSDDLALVTRARAALGEVRAFQRLNEAIIKRCQEPVSGAYGDWRDEFGAGLERVHALDRALQRRLPETGTEPPTDDRLRQFAEAEGQVLYSRCLRWSTLLIQRESPVRAGIAASFGFLKESEARLRAIIGNDAQWQEWRAAGALP